MNPILLKPKLKSLFKLLILTSFFCFFYPILNAQLTPFENWTTTSGTQNFFVKSKTVTDGSGNIYVAGATVNGNGNYDILVSKFNSSGVLQWSQQKDGLAGFQDGATALCIDGSGNVYITGFIADTLMHGTDVITIKYNSGGTEQWASRYNGVGNFHDFGSDIYADGSGNVYVVGSCQNAVPNADFMVIKYNSSGVKTWINIFNYAYDDAASRIKSVSAGKITVAGVIQGLPNAYAYGHLSYNTSTGAIIGSLSMGSSSTDIAREFAYTQDNAGNTYLAGAIDNGSGHGLDYCIIKFDTSAAIVWESHYNGADGLEDIATDVIVDGDGNVYATGYTTTTSEATNFTTLKFDPAGDLVWEQHYNDEGNGADTAMAMTMHSDTTFVITGSSFNGANQDYYTIKYDTTGAKLWEINYNSHYNRGDGAHSIAIANDNSIIVTGQSYDDVSINYTTIKYIDPWIMDTLTDGIPLGNSFSFIENRGQIIDTDEDDMSGIRFYNNQQEYSSYFTDTLISYVFSSIDTSAATEDTLHRVDLRFVNPLAGAKVYGKDILREYNNYYLPQTAPNGREKVPLYKELYMPSLWNNIDLKITSNPEGIKYAFILYPGFDAEQPSFSVEGYDNLDAHHGKVFVETSLGDFILDLAEDAFQVDENGDHISLGWRPEIYLDHNIVTFVNYGSYDPALPLVIVFEDEFAGLNPTADYLCWSTYFGGNEIDMGYAIDVDYGNNQCVAGVSWSTDFPTISGAYNNNTLGNPISFASKFRPNHDQMWSTYYGGPNHTHLKDIKFKPNGNAYAVGYSDASCILVSKVGATNNAYSGGADGLILEFNPLGSLIWATHLGGTGDDRIYSIDFGLGNDFYITGYASQTSFPTETLAGHHNQGSYGGGSSDAFIARFDNSNLQVWNTYYGGNGFDWGQSIKTDGNGNIFVQGGTYSSNFPTEDPGGDAVFDNSLGGTIDEWIIKFDVSGSREWATLIGGSGTEVVSPLAQFGVAHGNHIAFDSQNNIYLVGSTQSSDFPMSNLGGYYEGTWNDNCGYVYKFDAITYEPLWQTFLSPEGKTYINAIVIDNHDGIFIAGSTSDSDFPVMQITNQFYQDALLGSTSSAWGNVDGCLLAFDRDHNQLYGTLFGGDQPNGNDGEFISDLALYNDQLYLIGYTGATSEFPLYDPGNNADYWDIYNGASMDAFITKVCTYNITSVSEIEKTEEVQWSVYPNPANNILNVFVDSENNQNAELYITDITGRLVSRKNIILNNGSNIIHLDISLLSEAVYFVNLSLDDFTQIIKFIKLE